MNTFQLACAVCGAGVDDAGSGAYLWMSVVISLLPLVMLGGILAWVVTTVRAAEKQNAAEPNAAPRSEP